MEEVRFQWDDIMMRHGREAQYWLEYAELERSVRLSVVITHSESANHVYILWGLGTRLGAIELLELLL